MGLLDYLFVESCRVCRQLITPGSSEAVTLCHKCWIPLRSQSAQLDWCIVPEHGPIKVAYSVLYEKTMKLLIYKLKYDNDRLIANDFALLLGNALEAINQVFPVESCILVPIPLSRWRKLKRGFNQSELLAEKLSTRTNVPVKTNLLSRKKHTKAQHNLSREERSANLLDAFKCHIEVPDNLLLVDDIHTSGSTLREAARTLIASGAKNLAAVTVARAVLN